MAAEPTGERLQFRYDNTEDQDLIITTRVRYTGTDPEEICRAFFFESFYLTDAPVLRSMICTSEQHHYTGESGSFFDIDGFRPAHLSMIPAMGNDFHLAWEGDLIKGSMDGALWAANWHSHFKRVSGGWEMIEEFHIEGAPNPEVLLASIDSPLRQLFNTWAWTANRLPLIGGMSKLIAARICADLHKYHAPYHETIPKRINALRRAAV